MSSAGVRGNTHSLAEDTLLHNVKAFIDPKGRERHICKAVLSLGPRHHPGVLGGERRAAGAGRGVSLTLWVFIQLREKSVSKQ